MVKLQKKYNHEDNLAIEKAVVFLVTQFQQSGNNPKPVILHSMKVAFLLYSFNYTTMTIIAAILHDLIEDTKTTQQEISARFGQEVGRLVASLTFDRKISDRKTRYINEIDKAINFGKAASLIKAADLFDNSQFYHLADKKIQPLLLEKLQYFLDKSEPLVGKEPIWKQLLQQFQNVKTDLDLV